MRHFDRLLLAAFLSMIFLAGPAPRSLAQGGDEDLNADIESSEFDADDDADSGMEDTGYEHAKPYGWSNRKSSGKNKYVTPAQSKKMILSQQADNALYNQMLKVKDWLTNYAVRNRRLPEQEQGSLDQVKWAKMQLSLLVPGNPYKQTFQSMGRGMNPASSLGYGERSGDEFDMNVTYSGEAGDEGAPLPAGAGRFHWQYDPSLNKYVAETYIKNPPADWEASPGSITILNNQLNMFILWGAGANGKVLRNPDGSARVLVGHWVGGGPQQSTLE